jgi:DNA-binding response OmpR family regulator
MNAQAPPEAAHVLLVEDDDGIRALVTRILRESGYRVTGCRSGADMWSLQPDLAVDLVLLDVMLPGVSGFDLLRALRAKGADSDGSRPPIPTRSRPAFRFDVGHHSEMKPATR